MSITANEASLSTVLETIHYDKCMLSNNSKKVDKWK